MIERIRESFNANSIQWRKHSLERMLEREITRADVRRCIVNGKILKKYTDTGPYPAYLIEGLDVNEAILHTVIGFDEVENKSYIITVYYPDEYEK